MWNKPFEKLRRRMTCLYAAIFGALILVIVAAAYTFIWWEILAHEKENLVAQIYHEGEEWVESEEAPCSEAAGRIGGGSLLRSSYPQREDACILCECRWLEGNFKPAWNR